MDSIDKIVIRGLSGNLYGAKSPSILVELGLLKPDEKTITFINEIFYSALIRMFPNLDLKLSNSLGGDFGWINLAKCVNACLHACNFSYIQVGTLIHNRNGLQFLVIPCPINTHKLMIALVKWIFSFNEIKNAKNSHEVYIQNLSRMLEQLKKMSIPASNVPHFLKAAIELDIPTVELTAKIIQFGYGSMGRWLDSTFTDKTPQISAAIARNKLMASKVLRDAGFPVASNMLVANSDQAVKVADKLGYPVVVKPVDLDGGLGVAAGLLNATEVVKAYDQAKKHSNSIMVEKHIHGRDYRLNIFNNELLWAIERVPAGVVGDSVHNITELVEIANKDSRRGQGMHAKMKRLELDDEALDLLSSKGVTVDTVLSNDEYMPLRRRANVSSGGTPVAVMDKVHPDNRLLAIRATAAIGLDIAGVDLLIPDISQSWLETGCAICEINGQPQLGSVTSSHVYLFVLQELVTGRGRIPITLIVGSRNDDKAKKVIADYESKGLNVGYATRNGLFVGQNMIRKGYVLPYYAGRTFLRDRKVDAIVMEINDFSLIKTGLPFDCFDKLIYAGNSIINTNNVDESAISNSMDEFLNIIKLNMT